MLKANLFVITNDSGSNWTDDSGGDLFVSERMAEQIMIKHQLKDAGCRIEPCNLDDDLAQMCKLYQE